MSTRKLRHFFLDTLRGRLILGVAVVHAIMMTLFIFDTSVRQREMLLESQAEHARTMAQFLAISASGWLAADDVSGLQELVEAERRSPEIRFAMLTDRSGRILAHTDTSKVGLYVSDLPASPEEAMLARTLPLVDVAMPAMLQRTHVGWARVGLGQADITERLARMALLGVAYALGAIVIGAFVAWRLGLRITQRLYAVQDTIGRVRAGERTARSDLTGSDEAASIAREFNAALDLLDATDRALVQGEARYRLLLRSVRAAVIVFGPDRRIRVSNPVGQALLGLPDEPVAEGSERDPAWEFVREDGQVMSPDEHPVSRVVASSAPVWDLLVGVRRPDRPDILWALMNAGPLLDETGNVAEVITTFMDVTTRMKLEDQLRQAQKMEAVGQLAGGITHDFNNILTAILGYASMLKARTPQDDRRRGSIDQILAAGERAAHLTHGLLAFSRKQVIDQRPVDLNIVVHKVETLLERLIGEDIELSTGLADQVLVAMADASQVEQVLMNLATNARDAMPDGGRLTIATRELEADADFAHSHGLVRHGRHAVITVSDTGVGMSKQIRDRIYEPFFTTKDVGRGTGLGMAIVYGIVRAHNGGISVYSEPGLGTTFHVYLPLVTSPAPSGEVEAPRTRPPGGHETILLAEGRRERAETPGEHPGRRRLPRDHCRGRRRCRRAVPPARSRRRHAHPGRHHAAHERQGGVRDHPIRAPRGQGPLRERLHRRRHPPQGDPRPGHPLSRQAPETRGPPPESAGHPGRPTRQERA